MFVQRELGYRSIFKQYELDYRPRYIQTIQAVDYRPKYTSNTKVYRPIFKQRCLGNRIIFKQNELDYRPIYKQSERDYSLTDLFIKTL